MNIVLSFLIFKLNILKYSLFMGFKFIDTKTIAKCRVFIVENWNVMNL